MTLALRLRSGGGGDTIQVALGGDLGAGFDVPDVAVTQFIEIGHDHLKKELRAVGRDGVARALSGRAGTRQGWA
jgi:hypothetical protein